MTSWAYHMAVKIISWWVHPMHPMHFRSWLKDRQPAGGASFLHTDVVSPVSLSKCRDMRKPFENYPIHPATIILYYFHGLSYNPPMMVRLQSPEKVLGKFRTCRTPSNVMEPEALTPVPSSEELWRRCNARAEGSAVIVVEAVEVWWSLMKFAHHTHFRSF